MKLSHSRSGWWQSQRNSVERQRERDWPIRRARLEFGRMARAEPLRERFESERRRASFIAFLAGAGSGIILTDMWISHLLGVVGGVALGAMAYVVVFTYESLMWRRHRGR